jgi:hypothetical protein
MQWQAIVLTELYVAHMGETRNANKRIGIKPEDKKRLRDMRIAGRILLKLRFILVWTRST